MSIKLRGQRGEALNRFWAGETDAAHALAEMRGHATESKATPSSFDPPAKPTYCCVDCGGSGALVTMVDEAGHIREEECCYCGGTGVIE
jgi:hypothetical protein